MLYSQEPKYDAIAGQLVNRATRQPIPNDEPVFVLRAKDRNALAALSAYRSRCVDLEHIRAIDKRMEDFQRFMQDHPERMKEPDTRSAETVSAEPPRE